MRQAFAGMLWSKQYYAYDVGRWLDGDPVGERPPQGRRLGRNSGWRHFDAADILSMPDKWEYPWFAAWDLAFHAITLAHVDPSFAKYQLLVMCREWFQHPNGALPAYEWSFDDVNPPVHALAAVAVWRIDGGQDMEFLARIFHKLLMNFTWWLNRQDAEGNDLFSGGFLGLDNLSAFDRSHLPVAGHLEQSDATAWMYAYCMSMLAMATALAKARPRLHGPPDHVPRAGRPDRGRAEHQRPVGRRRRVLLRRPSPAGRRDGAAQDPLDGRPAADPARGRAPAPRGRARGQPGQALRALPRGRGHDRRRAPDPRVAHRCAGPGNR